MKTLNCCQCNIAYEVTDQKYQFCIYGKKKNNINYYCSKDCKLKARGYSQPQQVECLCCKKIFTKHTCAIKEGKNDFCSRSCAAKINNTIPGRVPRPSLRKCVTEGCKETLYSNRDGQAQYCRNCITNRKHIRGANVSELSIQDTTKRLGANKYNVIHSHCITLHKKEKLTTSCEMCEYPHHLELCHIKAISSFPKDAKLKIVNARENIMFLCRNCHWEYDNHFIAIDFD